MSVENENSVGGGEKGEKSSPELSLWTDTTEGSTFQSKKLKHWTESHLEGAERVLNPCAGVEPLDVDGETLRVDVNEDANADIHADFRDLLDYVPEEHFDAIVYDPPYTPHQARKTYSLDISDEEFYFYSREVMELFDRLLKPGGTFIQFGYSTTTFPREFSYRIESVSVFNKLGSQNDYLGVVAQKPDGAAQERQQSLNAVDVVEQNAGADDIQSKGNINTSGNSGDKIRMQYSRPDPANRANTLLAKTVNKWVDQTDAVLHIFEEEPRILPDCDHYTSCRYDCIDIDSPTNPHQADIVETPWNISSRFATGAFDAVLLDIPPSAFKQNIRTPQAQVESGSGKTHVATALKRSITDLVNGSGGRVIQIGRTATLMSGIDYDYRRVGVGLLEHPANTHDQIIAVDGKPHENIETVGLGEGEVDGLLNHPGRAKAGRPISSKHNRTQFDSSDDSTFCPHCGNNYYHHPAVYVDCAECGAPPGTFCRSEDGTVFSPSGPDHRLTADDMHKSRIERANERHSGDCNQKNPSYLDASNDMVGDALQEIGWGPEQRLEGGIIQEKKIKQMLIERFCNTPRSTNLPEKVLQELRQPSPATAGGDGANTSNEAEMATLDEFA